MEEETEGGTTQGKTPHVLSLGNRGKQLMFGLAHPLVNSSQKGVSNRAMFPSCTKDSECERCSYQ